MAVPLSLTRPWALRQQEASEVYRAIGRGMNLADRVAAEREHLRLALDSSANGGGRELDIRNGVAVIPIKGTLFAEDEFLAWLFRGTTYTSIAADFQAALVDPMVRAVLFDVDSPGGEVDGVSALARSIYDARGQGKEIVSFGRGMIASAGFWSASAADRIVVSDTSLIGSIGVLIPVVDSSKFEEEFGFKLIQIVSSQSPKKRSRPLDDEVIERYQTICNDTADIFVAAAALHRGVTADEVITDFGEGDVMIASKAVEAGMVDGVGTFEGTLAELAAPRNQPRPASSSSARAPLGGASTDKEETMLSKDAKDAKRKSGDPKETEDKAGKAEGGDEKDKAAEKDKDCAEGEDKDKEKSKSKSKKAEGGDEGGESAEHDDDEDEDEDDDEDDDDEKKSAAAMADLRVALGVGPKAGASAMYRAFRARFVPADRLAKAERQIAELRKSDTDRSAREARITAERFVDAAIADGRTFPDKRDVLVEDYVAAEEKKPGTGAARVERHLLPKGHVPALKEYTRHGDPPNGRHGGGELGAKGSMESVGGEFDRAVKAAMAKDSKLDYSAAMDVVQREQPHLYQQSRQG